MIMSGTWFEKLRRRWIPAHAILYARVEKVSRSLGDVDQHFDKEFGELRDASQTTKKVRRMVEIASQEVYDSRMDYHRLSEDNEVAENDLNEGLGCA